MILLQMLHGLIVNISHILILLMIAGQLMALQELLLVFLARLMLLMTGWGFLSQGRLDGIEHTARRLPSSLGVVLNRSSTTTFVRFGRADPVIFVYALPYHATGGIIPESEWLALARLYRCAALSHRKSAHWTLIGQISNILGSQDSSGHSVFVEELLVVGSGMIRWHVVREVADFMDNFASAVL